MSTRSEKKKISEDVDHDRKWSSSSSSNKHPPVASKADRIELDYPELTGTYHSLALCADGGGGTEDDRGRSQAGTEGPEGLLGHPSDQGGTTGRQEAATAALSPLNSSQIISRRLKLDLRNETEIPIAGNNSKERSPPGHCRSGVV